MPAAIRRAAPTATTVSFLRLEDFSQGGGLPDGDYLWSSLQFIMFTPTKKDGTIVGPAKLSCQVVLEPPAGAASDDERRIQNYSLGTNAHLTYQPDPAFAGKKLKLVEGGAAAPLYEGSNFQILIKSLHDSASLPEDMATDDLSSLEGIVAHMTMIDEPASRKEMRSSTSEMDPQANRRPSKIAVVVEIKSAPWLDNAAPVPVAAATKAKANGGAKVNGIAKAVALPEPEAAGEGDDPILNQVAIALEQNMNGMPKLGLRMAVFKATKGIPNGSVMLDKLFGNDESLNAALGSWGFKVAGTQIVPV